MTFQLRTLSDTVDVHTFMLFIWPNMQHVLGLLCTIIGYFFVRLLQHQNNRSCYHQSALPMCHQAE